MPISAHSTVRAALDPWLDTGHSMCVIRSRRSLQPSGVSGVAEALAEALAGSSYRLTNVFVGRTMTDELRTARPDVVIIDASTADYDAARLCRDVHASFSVPIVAVGPADLKVFDSLVIDLLDAGALDVVRAGASAERLLAHVRAALRSSPPRLGPSRLTVGDVVIDLDAHVLKIDGAVVSCPPLLFSLLVALASAPNKVATREALLARVWGVEPGSVDTRRVRVAASLLRRVLGVGPRRPRLETVSRIGYRLAVD